MIKQIVFLIFSILLSSCNSLSPGSNVEIFSKEAINNVINANKDSILLKIDKDFNNENTLSILNETTNKLNQKKVLNSNLVSYNCTSVFRSGFVDITLHNLIFEYQFENGFALFHLQVKEMQQKLSLTGFNTTLTPASQSEINKFELAGKPLFNYAVLIIQIFIIAFVFVTIYFVLTSKFPVKNKIYWICIVLLVNVFRVGVVWNTGEPLIIPLNFTLIGISATKLNFMSSWIFAFNIPIGSFLFWMIKHQPKEDKIVINQETVNYIPKTQYSETDTE